MREVEYRYVADAKKLILSPLYVDDELLAHIVLGRYAKRWSHVRPMLEREGMPEPRRAMGGLYYLPAQLRFFDAREGLTPLDYGGFTDDGSANFGP